MCRSLSNDRNTYASKQHNAPVICIPGSLGAGDFGDIAGPKCRDLPPMSPGSAVDVLGF